MEWAGEIWKQSKPFKKMEAGLRILRDEKGDIRVGCGTEPIIRNYMGKMWGSKSTLPEFDLDKIKHSQSDLNDIKLKINGCIRSREVAEAINKLKKNKTPGNDLIPNEIFSILKEGCLENLTTALEKCRVENKFPKDWKTTEIRWIYKKMTHWLLKIIDQLH